MPVQDDDTIRVVSRSRSDGSGRGNLFLLSSSPEVDPEDRKTSQQPGSKAQKDAQHAHVGDRGENDTRGVCGISADFAEDDGNS